MAKCNQQCDYVYCIGTVSDSTSQYKSDVTIINVEIADYSPVSTDLLAAVTSCVLLNCSVLELL